MSRLWVAKNAIWALLALSFFLQSATLVQAQGHPPVKRSFRGALDNSSSEAGTYDFSLGSTLDDIVTDSTDTDSYDPLTIQTLRRLKEDSLPYWSGDDLDAPRTRHVVEKAFAIETGRSVAGRVANSDLRDSFRDVREFMQAIQDTIRYSVQNDGGGVTVSKKGKGSKLLELSLEFNLKTGLDPQLRLGDRVRLRYDYSNRRPVLEYGFSF